MTPFENQLNDLLVKLYSSIEMLEAYMVQAGKNPNLTISEIHLLEAVAKTGKDEIASISKISEFLNISMPSVTTAVNKLAGKGYVEKHKSIQDGRVVLVKLTREGRRAERAHQYFHRSMVHTITKELTEEDKAALVKGVAKLDEFLDRNINKYREIT